MKRLFTIVGTCVFSYTGTGSDNNNYTAKDKKRENAINIKTLRKQLPLQECNQIVGEMRIKGGNI